MLTKYATAEILDWVRAPSKIKQASLSHFSDYTDYATDDGYIYTRVRAISSRVNKNNDGWPAEELAKAYRTFLGKPIFVDHHNSDPSKARGVIVDAKLHVDDSKTSALDPYYATAPDNHKPPTWIELLLEVDAKRFPKLAQAITSGEIDGVSMGCNVERSCCSICSNWAHTPEEYCQHIISKGAEFDVRDSSTGAKTSRRSYEDCYDISFFEISYVFDPADETALVHEVKTSKVAEIHKEASDIIPNWWRARRQRILELKRLHPEIPLQEILDMVTSEQGLGPTNIFEQRPDDPREGSVKMAEAPLPQSMQTVAPEHVNTLRQIKVCPVCGSEMEDGVCAVCNFEEPPEGFDNPNLEQAQENVRQQAEQQMPGPGMPPAPGGPMGAPSAPLPGPGAAGGAPAPGAIGGGSPMMANVKATNSGAATLNVISEQRIAARKEKPILPPKRILSDLPKGTKVVKDHLAPTQSSNGNTMKRKAELGLDSPNPNDMGVGDDLPLEDGPDLGAPDDLGGDDLGIGGDDQIAIDALVNAGIASSPEEARDILDNSNLGQAIKEIMGGGSDDDLGLDPDMDGDNDLNGPDLDGDAGDLGMGGPEEMPRAARRKRAADAIAEKATHPNTDVGQVGGQYGNPEAGASHVNVDKAVDIDGTETDTWSNGEGDSLGQQTPVTNEVGSAGFGPIGQPVSKKRQAGGFPDHEPSKVSLDAPLKEEVGDPTKTFGSDDFHITEPVTTDANGNQVGGPIGQPVAAVKAHLMNAMRLAETEVNMGLVHPDLKFDRVAALEKEPALAIQARLDTLQMVKSAGLKKSAKRIGSVPPLGSMREAAVSEPANDQETFDAGLFY